MPDDGFIEANATVKIRRSDLPEAHPDYYTQDNCHLLGLSKRKFLELLRRDGAPHVSKIGKTRMVERSALMAYLARLGDEAGEARRAQRASNAAELDDVDRLLLEQGCVPGSASR